jgi:hypothetical protein
MLNPLHPKILKIISGGQTGVDQGALDAAMQLQLPTGGFCPKGRLSENGPIPKQYQNLTETATSDYTFRTLQNIQASTGTLICVTKKPLSGGTRLTHLLAKKNRKPCLIIDMTQPFNFHFFETWVSTHKISCLNIAGPRESCFPGIQQQTCLFLEKLLPPLIPMEETAPSRINH